MDIEKPVEVDVVMLESRLDGGTLCMAGDRVTIREGLAEIWLAMGLVRAVTPQDAPGMTAEDAVAAALGASLAAAQQATEAEAAVRLALAAEEVVVEMSKDPAQVDAATKARDKRILAVDLAARASDSADEAVAAQEEIAATLDGVAVAFDQGKA